MSSQLRRCTCSALFATEDDLCEHLEEYRSREQRLQAEVDKCRTHSNTNDIDNRDRNDGDQSDYDSYQSDNATGARRKNGSPKGYYCPFPSCQRLNLFRKKQALRRHFQQHVTCTEVCVLCFKVFRFTREFLRHADKHDNAGEIKTAYIKQTCDELREYSDKQLLAMSQGLSGVGNKKRTWEVAALGSETSGTQATIPATTTKRRGLQRAHISHTISPLSTSDANSPLDNLSQSSLLTASSSERHALIDVPSIAERNQGKGNFQSRNPTGVGNEVQGFFSDRSRVSHSPAPPQALLVSENLFHNIRVYFENSCRNMILDDHGTLLTPNGAHLHNLCSDFDSYCFIATMVIEKGLHVEFRRALSKASALVEQILRAEHPRTLACFLEVFIHFIQTGLPGVTSFLRDFIKRVSAKITKNGHPWGQICRLLGELDSESLEQAMAQIWKCTTVTFDNELGTFSPLAMSVRLDYIKRVYGITNCLEEEWLLRDLLAQFGGIPRLPTPRVMLNLAHNLNRQGRHDEAEEMALEVLSLLQQYEIYAKRIVESIESMKIISRSQFNQGKALAAEQTMREAIRMIVDQWGIQHSWVPEFKYVLEGWLRVWGREEDANTLRGEIEELMRDDEIIEQLDG